jgi:CRP-like cAMP-binding protein
MFAFYICALFIGSLVAMLEDLYSSRRQLKADQSLLGNFMLKRNIPSVLQARALNDLAMNHENMVEHGAYEEVLDKLAPSVRQEIRQELYYTVVQRHPFFQEMSNDALRHLCGQVNVVHAKRGEYIVRRGDVASSMYFIVEGQLLAQRNAADPIGLTEEDVYLTSPAFFGARCIFVESSRSRNVIALTTAELVQVSTSSIYAVSREYSEVGDALRKRLREAAAGGDICAHCGFGHNTTDCPMLGRQNDPSHARRRRSTTSRLSEMLKDRFARASTAPVASDQTDGDQLLRRPSWKRFLGRRTEGATHSPEEFSGAVPQPVGLRDGERKPSQIRSAPVGSSNKVPFSRGARTPSSPTRDERSQETSQLSSEEDDEALSPLSPLIQIRAGEERW